MKRWIGAIADRIAPGAVILLYHRVAELDSDPQLLAVHPKNFEAHLAILRDIANPTALTELGTKRGSVAVTFDDGYADNVEIAAPLLEAYSVPATIFVATGYCTAGRELWWDELERLLLPASDWNVEMRHDPTPQHRAYRELSATLRNAPVAERDRVLAELRVRAGISAAARATHRPLTVAQLRAIGGPLTVGAHTVWHPQLSALPPAEQRSEIVESKRQLEAWTGKRVTSFAYPFGGANDFSDDAVRFAREAGFELACANVPGTVRASTSRFALPRLLVRNWSGDEFRRRLGRLLERP
ncbi:MAG TPA: polysaccharide deacetylase family protein [Thermoanaerobaculia bacterium]|nr:polysaccharide deacetylase family protein [Thermoanaerobaculia bacterium]